MAIDRIRRYLEEDLWEPFPERMPWLVRQLLSALRILILAFRGFVRDDGVHHASALAFDTVLGLVPMLAFFFSALKGFGAYDAFVQGTLRPWIDSTFGPGEIGQVSLREAFMQVLEFGGTTTIAPLGVVGLAFLLYLVVVLLHTVEEAFNQVWGVHRPRTFIRKLADYSAILFVIPLGLLLSTVVAGWEPDYELVGPLHDVMLELTAMMSASLVFTFLYVVMPHTSVPARSAVIGGLVAGVTWYGVLQTYAAFQIGAARYSALYSSFATIPLFLVWIFVSWLVVLFGAEVAAATHNETGFRWRVHIHAPSPAVQRFVAVRLMVEVAAAFLRGDPPRSIHALAGESGVPDRMARSVLSMLVDKGLLAAAVHDGDRAYVPARDLQKIRISDLLDAIDHSPEDKTFAPEKRDPRGRKLMEVLDVVSESARRSSANISVAELVAQVRARETAGGQDAAAALWEETA